MPILFDEKANKEITMTSPILWKRQRTRVIDLSVMMENEHSSLTTKLYDVPNSMLFSMERNETK